MFKYFFSQSLLFFCSVQLHCLFQLASSIKLLIERDIPIEALKV